MTTDNKVREELASKLHDIYILEAKRQGDVRHKDKYEDLPENIKDFDRVLADFIIADRKNLMEALKEIAKGEGAYSLDQLKHAKNKIENMKFIAKQALSKAQGGE